MKLYLYDGDGSGLTYCKERHLSPEYVAVSDFPAFMAKCEEDKPDRYVLSGMWQDADRLTDFLRVCTAEVTVVTPGGYSASDKEFLLSLLESLPISQGTEGFSRSVYGYRRDEHGSLTVAPEEAEVVRRIFRLYVQENKGTLTVAETLNREGKRTGRGKEWNQVSVSRILSQPLYTGRTAGGRIDPACVIVPTEWYDKARTVMAGKGRNFARKGTREAYALSGLIRCRDCGSLFRRLSRHYKNDYVRWVCMERNMRGKDVCPNKTAVDEEELLSAIRQYFSLLLNSRTSVERMILAEYRRSHGEESEEVKETLNRTFRDMQDAVDSPLPDNRVLSALLDQIVIDRDGNVDIDLAIFSVIGVDSRILSAD